MTNSQNKVSNKALVLALMEIPGVLYDWQKVALSISFDTVRLARVIVVITCLTFFEALAIAIEN